MKLILSKLFIEYKTAVNQYFLDPMSAIMKYVKAELTDYARKMI